MSYFKMPCTAAAADIIAIARVLSPAFNQEEIEKTNQTEQIKKRENGRHFSCLAIRCN